MSDKDNSRSHINDLYDINSEYNVNRGIRTPYYGPHGMTQLMLDQQSYLLDRRDELEKEKREANAYKEKHGSFPPGFDAEKNQKSIDSYDKDYLSLNKQTQPEQKPDINLAPLAGGIAAFGKFALPFGAFAISLALCPLIWGVRGINKLRGVENEPAGKPLLAATGVYAAVMGLSVMEGQKHTPPRATYPVYSAPANIPQSGYQQQPSSPAAPVEPPRYRDTRALTEQFYRAVPAGAAYYELYQVSQTKYDLAYKRTIIDGRCIEVTDGHEGIETAAVRIPAPWKDGGVMEGYIYKDELVPAPECKPAGP